MSQSSDNNKQIAKNTIVLYVRMFLMMAVSLYTSRIVLQALGVEDFGIYNVVGGVVVFIGFLNSTMSTASSRFITVSIASKDVRYAKDVFSNILIVNILLALLIIFFSETLGLWFLYNKMQIPEARMNAAFWVFQISILSTVLNIATVPFNATIIANEKIHAFAFISLFDAFAKLGIAFFVLHPFGMDVLVLYASLILCVQVIDCLIYWQYSIRKFCTCKFVPNIKTSLLKKMLSFIGWSSYGSLVSMGFTQGLNILINVFCGPSVNASRGIAVQVQNAIQSFASNFQIAVNPQLIKSFTSGNIEYTRKLLEISSKVSFYLLCIIGIPVIGEADYILKLWLGQLPEYSSMFVRLSLCVTIWQSLAFNLRTVNQAEGNIRKFQIYECTWLLLILPASYMALKCGMSPSSVFVVYLFFEITANFIRIKIVLPKIKMELLDYIKSVYCRITIIFISSVAFTYFLHSIWGDTTKGFLCNCLLTELFMLGCMLLVGFKNEERTHINKMIYGFIQRKKL